MITDSAVQDAVNDAIAKSKDDSLKEICCMGTCKAAVEHDAFPNKVYKRKCEKEIYSTVYDAIATIVLKNVRLPTEEVDAMRGKI